jgi:UDP-2-acetamido-3-amino-2,3-dideoxy-glucuronate N-acetyltransferase
LTTNYPKNLAVIGCGPWGKNLVRNFRRLGVLKCICDSDQECLKELCGSYSDVTAETDCRKIFNDEDIKAVVISTPAKTHYQLAKESLEAGKDVFVEKPMALTVAEGEHLIELAKQKKRILMVGHLLEYHPAVTKLKELIKKGELGNINYIYSNRLNLGRFRTEENILWSFAPHDISVILLLLDEMPDEVACHDGCYLNRDIADVTVTNMTFQSGTRAHIFVSWLHPHKEHRLVVVGSKKMAVFDDVSSDRKLLLYEPRIIWIDQVPNAKQNGSKVIKISKAEPLRLECEHFIDCVANRTQPKTDGTSGLRVLKVLEASQLSMKNNGNPVSLNIGSYFVHSSSIVEEPSSVGKGTKIWHFCHVMPNAVIGDNCTLGQNVFVGEGVRIGNNVKLENNVSIFSGVTLEDDVFCGPSATFTNVTNPRSRIPRKDEFKTTLVSNGATIGANATIVCGHNIGRYAFVGAGAVITKDVPDYALVYGNPATVKGWICQCGQKLQFDDTKTECSVCHRRYTKDEDGQIAEC